MPTRRTRYCAPQFVRARTLTQERWDKHKTSHECFHPEPCVACRYYQGYFDCLTDIIRNELTLLSEGQVELHKNSSAKWPAGQSRKGRRLKPWAPPVKVSLRMPKPTQAEQFPRKTQPHGNP